MRWRSRIVFCCIAVVASVAARAGAAALPLGASLAGGQSLPDPWGLSVTVYGQSQKYELTSLSFDLPGVTVDKGTIGIENVVQEGNAEVDLWLLPFLNLFAIGGKIDGKTDVNLGDVQGLPVRLDNLRITYHGTVYGFGTTLAGGNDTYFGSLTYTWTNESLGGQFDSTASAWLIGPRVGIHDKWGSAWIGATYQKAQERHKGTIDLPFLGNVGFDVKLADRHPWNLQAGVETGLSRHWHMHIEGGFADRVSTEMGFTYRF